MSSRKPVVVIDDEDNFADGADLNFKTDEELALLLQSKENESLYTNVEDLLDDDSNSELIAGAADDLIEELDPEPFPDIRDLFIAYNAKYFSQRLNSVEVKWSPKMTLCAGLCCYERGGYCVIKMSEPILKYRTKKDLTDTLLHEMIHAYLFVTKNNKDRDGHGPEFTKLMNEINKNGHGITVYHSFHDEVNLYRNHWWQCDKCKNIVKRAMNRAPSPNDPWWPSHEQKCGGKYVKIKEPEGYGKKKGKKRKRKDDDDEEYKEEEKITKFFKKDNGDKIKVEPKENNSNSENKNNNQNNLIRRDISASQELKISREDVTEDKISGPSLPTNFPKIEFDSDIEEQELIRKPKKKGISSLANSTDELMNISNDSLTSRNTNINNSNDVNMNDVDIGFDITEEERRIQRDILADAALKRFKNNTSTKIEPKHHNVNVLTNHNIINNNNNNVQLNKTAVILPKKEIKILTEECPICSTKISGTEVEITIHVDKCLAGVNTIPETELKIVKDEPVQRKPPTEVKYQLADNLIVDDDVVVLD